MYDIIVLGMIPGTQIQISFQAYLGIFLLALVIIYVYRLLNTRKFLAQQIVRMPLHASQLHVRG